MIRIRGNALPSGEVVDLCADGDRWTTDPAPGAELIEGWLLPGLVDAHTHPERRNPAIRSMRTCCGRTCTGTSTPA